MIDLKTTSFHHHYRSPIHHQRNSGAVKEITIRFFELFIEEKILWFNTFVFMPFTFISVLSVVNDIVGIQLYMFYIFILILFV